MVDITPLISAEKQIITSYGGNGFSISGKHYGHGVIIFPDRVLEWKVKSPAEFLLADFSEIIADKENIEILLLGSGEKMVFPDAEILRELKRNGILVDVMNTGAACRTYNVLLSEERKVAAALVAV